MKIRIRSLLLVLIVLAAVVITVGVGTAGTYCSPGQIFPCGTYVKMKITTDKLAYNQGSFVTFTIKNSGTTSVWVNPSPVTIKDARYGTIVYDPNVDTCATEVCTMSASIAVPVQVEIKPGGNYKWTWDQQMNTGYACAYDEWECDPPSVGPGWYRGSVYIYGSDGTLYNMEYKSNTFTIR